MSGIFSIRPNPVGPTNFRTARSAVPDAMPSVPVLRADRLMLRPFADADAPGFVAAVHESVETVGRWMSWCHAGYNEREALDWFAVARGDGTTGAAHEFGVFDADSGALVGGAGLNLINRQHRYCNLGYWVRQSRHREGIASRCVAALLAHAFGRLALRRVEIVVAVGNEPSAGVARKAGALFETVARNRIVIGTASMAASVFSLVPPATPD